MLRQKLQLFVSSAVNRAGESGVLSLDGTIADVEILSATGDGRGDFACAIAARLAGAKNSDAKALAQAIAKWLNDELLDKAEVAENGFINLFVSRKALSISVQSLIISKELEVMTAPSSASRNDLEELVYARHRLSASLRQLTQPRLNLAENCLEPALIDKEQWRQVEGLYARDMRVLEPAFDDSLVKVELALTNRRFALLLDEFWTVADRYREYKKAAPVRTYLDTLALGINRSHFLDGLVVSSTAVRNARIGLVLAAKRVFEACLGILNLAVPEKL